MSLQIRKKYQPTIAKILNRKHSKKLRYLDRKYDRNYKYDSGSFEDTVRDGSDCAYMGYIEVSKKMQVVKELKNCQETIKIYNRKILKTAYYNMLFYNFMHNTDCVTKTISCITYNISFMVYIWNQTVDLVFRMYYIPKEIQMIIRKKIGLCIITEKYLLNTCYSIDISNYSWYYDIYNIEYNPYDFDIKKATNQILGTLSLHSHHFNFRKQIEDSLQGY